MSSALRQLARRAAPQFAALRGGNAPAHGAMTCLMTLFLLTILFLSFLVQSTPDFIHAHFCSAGSAAHDDHHDDHGHHSYYPSPVSVVVRRVAVFLVAAHFVGWDAA